MTRLQAIEGNATHVLNGYREAAERYRDRLQADAQSRPALQHVGINRDPIMAEEIRAALARCDDLHRARQVIAELLPLCLPEVAKRCPTVLAPGVWHNHGVDWGKAEAELLAIRIEAQRAIAAGVEVKPESPKAEPVTNPVAQAVLMKWENPRLSIRKAAAAVGIPYLELYRNPLWQTVCENLKQIDKGNVHKQPERDPRRSHRILAVKPDEDE